MLVRKIVYRFRNDNRLKYYEKLKKNLLLSPYEMRSLQGKCINKLIEHAYDHTQYYREIMDSLGIAPQDINSKDDLRKLPILTKKLIKENFAKLTSDDHHSKGLKKFVSGGTSSEPSIIYKSPYFFQMSQAAFYRDNLMAGWNPEDKWVWIWGSPHEHKRIKGSLLSRLGLFFNRALLVNAYKYSREDYPLWVSRIQKFKPRVLYGYSGIVLGFAEYLLANGIAFPSLKSVICTSEILKNREVIEKAFGCNVYNQYGCREVLSIAIESQRDVMRISDDTVALNVYRDNAFIITALHSYGFPMINYKLGDCGSISLSHDTQHDKYPFSKLNISIGRETNRFITKDGHIVDSACLECYMYSFELPVNGQQIIQNSHTQFCINYIPTNNFDGVFYKRSITKCLNEYFGDDLSITFNAVKQLPKEKSGKTLIFKRTFD